MNSKQAGRLRGRLAACFPGSAVDVTPHSGGARIFIQHDDGYVQLTTGDQPGVVLRMMLERDFRAVDDAAPEGVA